MGSLREIKDRIGSVKSTLKITSAMKLVASSKLRKSQKAIETMLPYRRALEDILSRVGSSGEQLSRLCSCREGGRTAIIAVASNSSLCGAFNVNAVKATLKEASKHDNTDIIGIGRKMAEALRRAGFPQARDWSSLIGKPSYAAAGEFACDIVRKFTEGEYSEVIFVYNHFVSTSRQEVVVERYLPLPAEDVTDDVTEIKDEYNPYILEPSAEEIADIILPKVLELKVYTVLLDSAASEHAARTIAMQTATDNAEDILGELTLEYNKGRQQKITAEILDLVGGNIHE